MQSEIKYLLLKKGKLLLFFLLVTSAFFYHTFQRTERIDWDVFGYYLYLPAKFIHNDINLEKKEGWLDPAISKYKLTDSFYQAYKSPTGKYVFKYSMGMSVLYSPFFFAADVFVKNNKTYERDGFSLPYQVSMRLFVLTMILLGLFYLYKILRIYFSEYSTLFTLFLLVFGTNYYVMSFADGLMPHLSLFTLFSILLFYTIKWHQQQKIKYAAIVGVCLGIAVLIRPTSAVVVVIPILWGVNGIQAIGERMYLFLSNFRQLLILILLAFVVILPQLLYWHTQTNQWLFYSYPDEKLNFFTPHLTEIFFSYKKGWLLYTPAMCIAIIGFVFLYKNLKTLFLSIFLFFIINTYIISAWDCWWYGGSFAHRAFVESYVFMAFPLAAFFEHIYLRRLFWGVLVKVFSSFFLLSSFFIFLNIFQTHQALNGIIHTSRTTKEYYWKVFLKNNIVEEDKIWLEPLPYYSAEYDEPDTNLCSVIYKSTNNQIAFENNNAEFSGSVSPTLNVYADYKHKVFLRFTAQLEKLPETTEQPFFLVGTITLNGKLFQYRSKEFNQSDLTNNNGRIDFSFFIPPHVSLYQSELKCYVYNPNRNFFKIHFLKVEVLKYD